jgi:VCBS repeat-containing protein
MFDLETRPIRLNPWISLLKKQLARVSGPRRRGQRAQQRQWARAVERLEDRCLLAAPELVAVLPNVGSFLVDNQVRTQAPDELTLRFSPGQTIDVNSLGGIVLTRAGFDGDFEEANVYSDFNTNGAVVVEFDAQRLGVGGNGISLAVSKVDLGLGVPPTISVVGTAITATLNSNVVTPTTAQSFVDSINNNPAANALVQATIRSGVATTNIAAPAVNYSPLVLRGANAAVATSNFNTGVPLEVKFESKVTGPSGNGVSLVFRKADLGAAGNPTVVVTTPAPQTNPVTPAVITVTLNTNAGNITTAQRLVTAITSSFAANALVRVTVPVGVATTDITTPVTINPLTLDGANDESSNSAFIQSSFNAGGGFLMRFEAVPMGTAGNGITMTFSEADLGVAGLPAISVLGTTITITLNTNKLSTAADLITAITASAAANRLVRAFVVSGVSSTNIVTPPPAAFSLVLGGGTDVLTNAGYFARTDPVNNEVVYRFAQPLPDDLYRIEVYGQGPGTILRNTVGDAFNNGLDSHLSFDLDLGAQVTAVVPQPVLRNKVVTVSNIANLREGDRILLTAGGNQVVLEFNDTTTGINPLPGNVAVPFDSTQLAVAGYADTVAAAIAAAIAGSTLDATASSAGAIVTIAGRAFNPTASSLTNVAGTLSIADGGLTQRLNIVTVNFNEDPLNPVEANNPAFYQLIDTSNNAILIPTSVTYDSTRHTARLQFAANLPTSTFRLRIGESTEANNTTATAINAGTLFTTTGYSTTAVIGDNSGVALPDDVDLYKFVLNTAATTVTITATPLPTGGAGTLNAAVRLFDSAGVEIGAALDAGLAGIAEVRNTLALAAGTYYIGVSSSGNVVYDSVTGAVGAGVGTTTGSYQLAVTVAGSSIAASDDNSSFGTATSLGSLGSATQTYASQIEAQTALLLPPLPGGSDDPGHRDIPAEDHGAGSGTTPTLPGTIETMSYFFGNAYGSDAQGNTLFNQINAAEKQRTREIFEIFASRLGMQFLETTGSGLQVVTGDPRVAAPTLANPPPGIQGGPGVIMSAALRAGNGDDYGGSWMSVAFHEIGHAIGLGHSYDIPSIQGGGLVGEQVLTGDFDWIHALRNHAPFSTDIDLYQFTVAAGQSGTFSAETIAERLATTSLLNSALTLYSEVGGVRTLVSRNDDYYSNDSFLTAHLDPGTYYIGVTSTGNTNYDPTISDSGYGGTSDGLYTLQLSFKTDSLASLHDVDATPTDFDGDADRQPGGVYEFNFQGDADSSHTIVVDKSAAAGGTGTVASPYNNLQTAVAVAASRIVVPTALGISAGQTFTVSDGVNPTITFTFVGAAPGANQVLIGGTASAMATNIATAINLVGATLTTVATATGDRVDLTSVTTLNVVGTPALLSGVNILRIVGNGGTDNNSTTINNNLPYQVGRNDAGGALPDGATFEVPQGVTVMIDAGAIIKLQGANLDAGTSSATIDRSQGAVQVLGTPTNRVYFTSWHNDTIGGDSDAVGNPLSAGNWGGLVFRADSDQPLPASGAGVYLNYVNHADLSYGGGTVIVNSVQDVFDPVHLISTSTRPTRPTISHNRITFSADAAISADPNSFNDANGRIGPDIHNNQLFNNSTNGLFVRIRTSFGSPLDTLDVPARFNDTDIVHVITENLVLNGSPGGPLNTTARLSGRLAIDPGVVVKLRGSRIEMDRGASRLIAEGTAEKPIRFTSLLDDHFGSGGTFDTGADGNSNPDSTNGDWGGLIFEQVSSGSLDHIYLAYAGGTTPIEGSFDRFNPIEIRQADVRLTNSLIENNASGQATTNRKGRGTNNASTIFVLGSQPIIVNNIVQNNLGNFISINANSLVDVQNADYGRSTGSVDVFTQFADNSGPLVRLNRLDLNGVNGMHVRGEQLTVASVWDDTDVVHVLQNEVSVNNLHTYGGLRLQSDSDASLVVKLQGASAGLTANGSPADMDDRIGGTVQVVGQPGFPVVMTSLGDCSIGAGFKPDGNPQTDTLNSGQCTAGQVVVQTGNSGAVVIDGGDREEHGSALAGPDNVLGTGDDINQNGWLFIEQIIDFTYNGSKNNAPNDILVLGATSGGFFGGTLDAITSATTVLGLTQTVMTGVAAISAVNFNNFKVIFVPSNQLQTSGGITTAELDALTLRKVEIQNFINSGGSLVAMTEAGEAVPYGFLELPLPFQIEDSFFNINGGPPLRKTPAAIAAGFTISDIELGNGTPTHNTFIGPPGFNGLVPFVLDAGLNNIAGDADDAVITLGLASGSFGIGVVNPSGAGDWRSIQLNQYSNDRNVAVYNEREKSLTGNVDLNANPTTAEFLGQLAPDEKSGDDLRRLGYEVHGDIATDAPTDVDVYSFSANTGTEVWLDIDRTSSALDTMVELIDSNGTVVARSLNNSTLSGTAFTLIKVPNLGGDYFTQNPRDAGFRVTLPGTPGVTGTYFVRVRSQPVAGSENTLAGLTSGRYQLQIRLRQIDEFPGSTVSFADIRYATNGVEANGLPYHSPLLGDTEETTGDNNSTGGAQQLGNLLDSDRNTFSTAGDISAATDVDFYRFTVDYQDIQVVPGLNAPTTTTAPSKTWATVLDVDYANGLTRTDSTLALYKQNTVTGAIELVAIGRDSNIVDDQPAAGQGNDLDDLTRGTVGKLDPFLGSLMLPTGIPGQDSAAYLVAFSSDQLIPTTLNAQFVSGSTNQFARLEPANGTYRIVEDHIGFLNYHSNGAQVTNDPTATQITTPLVDISSVATLDTHVVPFSLNDVLLFLNQGNDIFTVNPFRGGVIADLTGPGNGMGLNNNTLQDIVMRSDGQLFAYQRQLAANQTTNNNTAGTLNTVNTVTTALTVVGNDGILGGTPTPTVNVAGNTNPLFNDFTITDNVDALAFERTGFGNQVGGQPDYSLFYSVRSTGLDPVTGLTVSTSKLYSANPLTGVATQNSNPGGNFVPFGIRGDIEPAGVTFATRSQVFSDNSGAQARVLFKSKVPGVDGNGITITYSNTGTGGAFNLSFPAANTIQVNVNTTAGPPVVIARTPQEIVDLINGNATARNLVTASVDSFGSGGGLASALFFGLGAQTLNGGTGTIANALKGVVTGLAFADFSGGQLYGVTDQGEFLRINKNNGQATLVRDFSLTGITGFQGLALGPQNVADDAGTRGAYANTLFAITTNGQLVAMDINGNGVIAFDSDNEVQTVTIAGAPTLGSHFTLSFDSGTGLQTTDPILYTAPGAVSLDEIQTVDVVAYSGTYTLSLVNDLFDTTSPVAAILASVPGTPGDTFVVEDRTGFVANSIIRVENEEMLLTAIVAGAGTTGTFTVTRGIHGAATAPSHPLTSTVFEVLTTTLTAASVVDNNPATVTIPVVDTTSFPGIGSIIRIDSEDMAVTAVGATSFTVTRGANGTIVANHAVGATVYRVVTTAAAGLNFNSTPAQIDTALTTALNLAGIVTAAGDILTSPATSSTGGTPTTALATPVTVQFAGALGKRDLFALTGDITSLNGDEIQRITLGNTFFGGTFTLNFGATVIGPIAYDAPATGAGSVQAAFDAALGAGNTVVSGGALPGTPIDVEFTGTLQDQNFVPLTMNGGGLSNFERQQFNIGGGPTGGTFTITVGATTTGAIAFNAPATGAGSVQAAFDAAFGVASTVVSGGPLPGAIITVDFTGFLDTNVGTMTANLAALTPAGAYGFNVNTLVQGNTNGTISTPRDGNPVSVPVTTTQDGILSVFDALVGLANIGPADLLVSGGDLPGTPVNVTFGGVYAGADVNQMVVDNFGMSLGTSASVNTTGTIGDGLADNFVLDAGLNNATGLAFSPLDFNLWHPTDRRGAIDEPGHGINAPFDNSRTPDNEPTPLTGGADTKDRTEATGGASLYFGLDPWNNAPSATNGTYFQYQAGQGQFGILNDQVQRDLTANPAISTNTAGTPGTYNLPGGALGSVVTNSFSLTGYNRTDKPTLYFNYLLDTEGQNADNSQNSATFMRDSARVSISRDGGASWQLVATNNSILSSTATSDAELPSFLSVSRQASTQGNQQVQELFETRTWRQARVDLADYAGNASLMLRFDFSTAGTMGTYSTGGAALIGLPGDENGLFVDAGTDLARTRGQTNQLEGFFVDDIIVGFAERGEMVTSATNNLSSSFNLGGNGRTTNPDPDAPKPQLTGAYQLEIRRGTEYATVADPTDILTSIGFNYDTNDRLLTTATFKNAVGTTDDFESGDFTGAPWQPLPTPGPTDKPFLLTSVPAFILDPVMGLPVNGAFSARSFYDPTTSTPLGDNERSRLQITVYTGDGDMTFTRRVSSEAAGAGKAGDVYRFFLDVSGGDYSAPLESLSGVIGSTTVSFHVDAGVHTFLWEYVKDGSVTSGQDGFFLDDITFPSANKALGDENFHREQGQLLIANNLIRNVSQAGIVVAAAPRDGGTNSPHPGSPINFDTLNTPRLAPGVTIANNVVTDFVTSGISFAGEPNTAGNVPAAAVPFGRIVNNTIYGGATATGTGISVSNNASPTILNNIIANTANAMIIDNSSSTGAISATQTGTFVFQGNTSLGTVGGAAYAPSPNDIQLLATDALFLSTSSFYLASGSSAIDSSINVLPDRAEYVAVTGALGIPESPIFAPDRDLYGQLRRDDPAQASFPGLGSNIFKDRGAVERADFLGPTARMVSPLDDDPSGVDLDSSDTNIHIDLPAGSAPLTQFIVEILDAGIGVDDVLAGTSLKYTLQRDGVTLFDGVDYQFVYNNNTNQAIFTSVSTFPLDSRYTLTIANDATNGIKDLAGNRLQGNQPSGIVVFTILVTNGVNDAPVNSFPGPQAVIEDGALNFSALGNNAISIGDVDAHLNGSQIQVTLTVTNGTAATTDDGLLTMTTTAGLTFGPGANGTNTMTFAGTIAAINAALDTLRFNPGLDRNDLNNLSSTVLTITTSDLGNTHLPLAPVVKTDTDQVSITVIPVNDEPVITTVPNQGVAPLILEDSVAVPFTLNLTGLFAARATATDEIPPAATVQSLVPSVSSSIVGFFSTLTITNFNAALGTADLNFLPALNGSGLVTVTVTLVDNGGIANLGDDTLLSTFTIFVTPVNDEPLAVADAYTVNEDTTLTANGVGANPLGVLANDSDPNDTNPANVLNAVLIGGAPTNAMSFTLNSDGTFTYTPVQDFNGIDTFQYEVRDDGGVTNGGDNIGNIVTVTITVDGVNDAPVHTLPAAYVTNEDIGLPLSGISIVDVDVAAGNETVTFSVTSGTLTVNTAVGGGVTAGQVANNGTATVTITAPLAAINATLANATGLTFNPASNKFGTATLTMTTNDNGNTGVVFVTRSDSDTSIITVNSVNDAPVGASDFYATAEDTPIAVAASVGVLANDTDPNDTPPVGTGPKNALSVNGATPGAPLVLATANGGTVTLNSNGSFIYTPPTNYVGSDTFTYRVRDDGLTANNGNDGTNPLTSLITVFIDVGGINDPPVNNLPAAQTTIEDTPLVFSSLNGNQISVTDPDAGGNPVRVTLSVNNGTLTLSSILGLTFTNGDGTSDASMTFSGAQIDINTALNGMSFVPTLDFHGAATLSIISNDLGNTGLGGPQGDSDSLAITILPSNDAPIALADSYSTNEDATLNVNTTQGVLFNDGDPHDVPANQLFANLVTGPTNGTLNLATDGSFSYTPSLNYNGVDSFTYRVTDSGGTANNGVDQGNVVTVTITINPVNDAPVNNLPVAAQSVLEDNPLVLSTVNTNAISVTDVDVAGSALLVTLTATDGVLTLSGLAGLTFSSGDGAADPSMAFTGTLAAINTALNGLTFLPAANFNTPGTGRTATVNITTNDQGFTGAGSPLEDSDTVFITVNPVNDPPVAQPDFYSTSEDTTLTVAASGVLGNDSDPLDNPANVLSATKITDPSNGTLTVFNANGGFTYVPNPNFNGTDSFTYQVRDDGLSANGGNDTGNTVTVTINVGPVNDAPVNAVPGTQAMLEERTLVFSAANSNLISTSDIDAGVAASVRVTLTSANGTATLGSLAGLTFTAGDGTSDTSMTFSGTLTAINAALAGTSFTPSVNFTGTASLSVTTSDLGNSGTGGAQSDTDLILINVANINDPPVALPDAYSVNEDNTLTVLVTAGVLVNDNDSADAPADTLTATNLTDPLNGTLTFSTNGSFTYVPNANFNGTDSFTYAVSDNGGILNGGNFVGNTVTVTITVNAVNDAPVNNVPAAQTTLEDSARVFNVPNGNLISVTDVDAASSTVRVTLTGASGTVTLGLTTGLTFTTGDGTSDASMTFSGTLAAVNAALAGTSFLPAANFVGTSSVTITTNDLGNSGSGGVLSDTDTINIAVTTVNDPPVAVANSYTTSEDTPLTIAVTQGVLVNDSDPNDTPANGLSAVKVTDPLNGTLSLNADGSFTYTPALNYNGPDSFQYQVQDNGGVLNGGINIGNTVTVNLTVNPVNDAPVNNLPAGQSTDEDTAKVFASGLGNAISITDVDSGSSSVRVTLTATNGTLTLSTIAGLTFSGGDGTTDATMTFTGNVAAINTALTGMSFAPTSNFNGSATLTIVSNDQGNTGSGGTLTDTDTLNITVNAVNDAPVNGVPGAQTTNDEDPVTFSATNGKAITLSDVDAGSATVRLTLFPIGGLIQLPTQNGLTLVQGDGSAGIGYVFDGTLANLNTALNGLQFRPTTDFNGAASLQVMTGDQGNTGTGGPLSDSDTINITVNDVNDAPVNSVPGVQTVSEDGSLVFNATNRVSINDVDARAGVLRVVLTTANGTLSLGSTSGLTFLSGNGTQNTSMSFTGTLASLNTALTNLTFIPNANFNGSASFTMTTDDQGNSGSGGSLSDTDTVALTTTSVNDAPTVGNATPALRIASAGDPFTIAYATLLAAMGAADVDVGDVTQLRVEQVVNGTLTKGGVAVVPGTTPAATSIGPNDSLVWTPPANVNASLPAFVLRAIDSTGTGSVVAATVTIDVTTIIRYLRSYNPRTDYHFFTMTVGEFNNAVTALGYRDENTGRPGFEVATGPATYAYTHAIHRLYNPNNNRHYYTANTVERDILVGLGYRYEKDEGYIFTEQVLGTVPIFRLYNTLSGTHLLTESVTQRDTILATFPGIWVRHSDFGFAFPISASGTPPVLAVARGAPALSDFNSLTQLSSAESISSRSLTAFGSDGQSISRSGVERGSIQIGSALVGPLVNTSRSVTESRPLVSIRPAAATSSATTAVDNFWQEVGQQLELGLGLADDLSAVLVGQ